MAVKLNKHDLEFVLKQIKIAEAHTAGTPLTDMIVQPHLPYGLRTVDGTYNNIIPGRELWGAADQTMPRIFDPNWRNDNDGDSFDVNGPTQPGGVVNNGNYNSGGATGSIADADPRLISNLIVDQTPGNPAALIAALRHAGHEGDLTAKMASITVPFALVHAAHVAEGRVASWQKMIADTNAAIQSAIDAGQTPSPALTGLIPMLQGNLAQAQGAAAVALAAANAHQLTVPDGPDADLVPDVIIGAQNVLEHVAVELGIEFEVDGRSLKLPNVAPDEGLSAPFNGWMTFFGQFFDHGLDLISKGGDGTIYVPLQPDDPLYVPGGFTNFMVLTRATQVNGPGADGVLGTTDDTREAINVTTPFVDQNQTYTSHPSHQVFLREYEMVDGRPMATGRMLDGANGGLPTWADVKAQAANLLGIRLTDSDVFNIPLIRTDLYGEFIRDANGFPQVIIALGADGLPNTDDDVLASGTAAQPLGLLNLTQAPTAGAVHPVRTSHSFLDDIAHNAVPILSTEGILLPDNASAGNVDPAGNAVQFNPLTGRNLEYDNELLDKHFITGDGRGNENIGLTAVHHVFHSEHNRQVEAQKLEILKTQDTAFINEWLATDLTQAQVDAIPTGSAALAAYAATLSWDGERMFQSARFATEMQYQHLVFEEFGRKVQPLIDVFVFNTITDIDPAIFAEFAHVVYRFGHSMLTEEIARMFLDGEGRPVSYDAAGNPVLVTDLDTWNQDIGLIEAFLNPVEFDKDGSISHEQAAGAIFRGMNRVHGNEIDEFVVDALRTNLLGLPLDLAAINIARGRDTGMPTLNQARAQLYEASNSTFVKPYDSWSDFASNLKNPASVINFIAAYGTHDTIEAEMTLAGKRAAATALVMGQSVTVTIDGVVRTFAPPADSGTFLRSAGWTDSNGSTETGLNLIDLWIGGLAEKKMPFGGMLGSTFNAVFEAQMEMLQDLDRFYYLTRTQGLNLLNELENNAFSKLIMANTDMTNPGADGVRGTEDDIINYHVGVDSFAKHDFVLEVDPAKQIGLDPVGDDPILEAVSGGKVLRDNPNLARFDTMPYVGDVDGDGDADLFRYVPGSSGADMYLSTGTGFERDGSWTGAGSGTQGWYVGNFDGVGGDDIFRYLPGTTGAGVFLSNGTSFTNAGSWTGAGSGTQGWYVGNFDGLGGDDIFRYMPGASGADMFLSNGTSFVRDGSWTGAGSGTQGWYVGDFNGDGMDDIFRYMPGASGADMFLSNGNGFVRDGSWTGAGSGTLGWYVGDFDGDGDDDILRQLAGGAEVLLSNGTGFVSAGIWTTANPGAEGWSVADYDGDGTDDLLRLVARRPEILLSDGAQFERIINTYLRFTGGEHTVIGGTEKADTIIADFGDDAIWGGGGNDRIEGGAGVDFIIGGSGDDIITDAGDTGDFIKGEDGDDVIANSNGLDVLMGGDGKDVFLVGVDATEVFGGEGDDFILGGADADTLLGNEGDDWMEGGDGFDVLNGDNSELFFNSTIIGHDVMFAGENENDFDAESGDDIMVQGESVMRNEGMLGFDWAIHKGMRIAANSDLRIPIFTNVAQDILRDRFDQTEGLSGWNHNDVLRGDDRGDAIGLEPELDMRGHELNQAGIDRIDGLRELLGLALRENAPDDAIAWTGGNILLGGDGHDTIEGRGGNDFIDGDAWLNVRIRLTAAGAENDPANQISTVDTLKHVFTAADVNTTTHPQTAAWIGKSLSQLLLTGVIRPQQLHTVREVLYADGTDDTDTAVYAGNRDLYDITTVGDRTIVTRIDNDPADDEGMDVLVNIERIQFADQIVTLTPTANSNPEGQLTIIGLPPAENSVLTVDASAISDADFPGGVVPEQLITFQWQVEDEAGTGEFVDIPGAQGRTFTPGDAEAGLGLRVRGTFVDGGNVREFVFSATTAPVGSVNDAPTGQLLISDTTPTQGQALTATVAFVDPDGITEALEEELLSFTWERASALNGQWEEVSEPSPTSGYTPGEDDVGNYLRLRVDYTDDGGTEEVFYSAPTSVVDGSANAAATFASFSSTDTFPGFEVIVGETGSTFFAGDGAYVVDGGLGNDTFVFGSATAADGDVIRNFAPGDKIDLSLIDADAGVAGTQAFTLSSGANFTAAGQVLVTHEVRGEDDYTIVRGNLSGDAEPEFTVELTGRHDLKTSDFNGVA